MLFPFIFEVTATENARMPLMSRGERDNRCRVLAKLGSAPSSIRSQAASLGGETAQPDLSWNSPFSLTYLLALSLHIQGSYNKTFTAPT